MEPQQVINNIDQSPYLSNEQTINHYPDKFIIDFRYLHHQFVGNEGMVVINHKVIILDPWVIKNLVKTMEDNIQKYESKFGEITKPTAISTAENEHKLNRDNIADTKNLAYFG